MEKYKVKILGVYDEKGDGETSNISNKNIIELSKKMRQNKIPHIVLNDYEYEECIALIKDFPSVFIYNKIDKQWEYIARYLKDDDINTPKIIEIFTIQDNNKEVDILDFIKVIIKTQHQGD